MRMIRPLLPFLLLVCLAFPDLYSQAALGIFAQDVVAQPSTVNMGATVKYAFSVENKGNQAYTGMCAIWVRYDSSNGTDDIYDFQITNLQPNDTVTLLVSDVVTNAKYEIGDNTILIWPRSDNPNVPTTDTSSVEVTVADTGANGINDELRKRVKVFPNPNQGEIHLRFEGIGNNFECVRLINMQGQALFESKQPVYSIGLEDQPKGIYFVELTFKDGLRGTYRIIYE